jgi:hypothetical protein
MGSSFTLIPLKWCCLRTIEEGTQVEMSQDLGLTPPGRRNPVWNNAFQQPFNGSENQQRQKVGHHVTNEASLANRKLTWSCKRSSATIA